MNESEYSLARTTGAGSKKGKLLKKAGGKE